MAFSMKLTPKVESALWGAAGGAAALAPICVDKFRHATNADENLGKLKAISYSWEKGTYVSQGGWATLPGNAEPNSAVAQACAEMLSTAAK